MEKVLASYRVISSDRTREFITVITSDKLIPKTRIKSAPIAGRNIEKHRGLEGGGMPRNKRQIKALALNRRFTILGGGVSHFWAFL
jgi:hypothetical protein